MTECVCGLRGAECVDFARGRERDYLMICMIHCWIVMGSYSAIWGSRYCVLYYSTEVFNVGGVFCSLFMILFHYWVSRLPQSPVQSPNRYGRKVKLKAKCWCYCFVTIQSALQEQQSLCKRRLGYIVVATHCAILIFLPEWSLKLLYHCEFHFTWWTVLRLIFSTVKN